jgi:thiol:disulfide interchange protein DsbD
MTVPPGGPIPTTITVVENETFSSAGEPVEPPPMPKFDPNFNMQTPLHEGVADFLVPVAVNASASPGANGLVVKVRFMACDDTSCLPPRTSEYRLELEILPPDGSTGGAASLAPAGSGAEELTTEPVSAGSQAVGERESSDSQLPTGTLAYIWFAMTMGALALLTPCVFPMIPITVSYFTKRDAKSRGRAIFEAAIYSVGIVATFTLLGFALTFLFGAGGINRLAASPSVNVLIALIFIVFALSLFGVIEIRVPSSWLSAISRKSSQRGGITGILLMSLTFSLTSFTCTVPFVGTVMVAALQGDLLWSLLGVTSFAAVFSLPFFLLALFPSWLQSLPKSGNWMNSVKITMGFLELAAALKFVSNVDLVYQWEWITRPVFITVWLGIGLVLAFYLLGWFRFSHEAPADSVGALRVISAILFFAVSFYLLRGLFGFPLGELDAFLPPRDYGVGGSMTFSSDQFAEEREVWLDDFQAGLKVAQETNRPLFLDFTGYTCTNCRWMEANVFPLPEVRRLFSRYVLVRLYTDGTEAEHEANMKLEEERFGTIALPFYALISPDNRTIATFPGLTRNPEEFIDFLRKGLTSDQD